MVIGAGEGGYWCRGGWLLVQGRVVIGVGEGGYWCRGGWLLV